jgi:hypothetical protein
LSAPDSIVRPEPTTKRLLIAFCFASLLGGAVLATVQNASIPSRSSLLGRAFDAVLSLPIYTWTCFWALVLLVGPLIALIRGLKVRRWWLLPLLVFLAGFGITFALGTGFFFGRSSNGFSSTMGNREVWIRGEITPFGWQSARAFGLQVGAFFSALSFVIWLVAYRRT